MTAIEGGDQSRDWVGKFPKVETVRRWGSAAAMRERLEQLSGAHLVRSCQRLIQRQLVLLLVVVVSMISVCCCRCS
jgi:hypothetical protein